MKFLHLKNCITSSCCFFNKNIFSMRYRSLSHEAKLVVDLRSDVLTKPSSKMLQSMFSSSFNDDVYKEDKTVIELQRRVAELTGKDCALFVPSGTMGNLISVLSHCRSRGAEVILGDKCHIFNDEQAGIAQFGGIQVFAIPNEEDGTFSIKKVIDGIREEDFHYPSTSLICVENTHNYCGGCVVPLSWLENLKSIATSVNLPVHMDAARVVNAAVASNNSVKHILQFCDSASICFSKGLGTPVGSIIVADRLRKGLGGGMRQPGMLAAAAIYALDNMVDRLQEDHKHAKMLAKGIDDLNSKQVVCNPDTTETNIVIVSLNEKVINSTEFCDRLAKVADSELKEVGIAVSVKTFPRTSDTVRFVTHSNVTLEQIEATLAKIKYIVKELNVL